MNTATTSVPSSTGGTIVETFNDKGVRISLVHYAGKAYSGKVAEAEIKSAKA